MKNFLIVLNVVLLVAVGVLFYLQFKSPKADAPYKMVADSASPASFKIVYFEMDSLDNKYEYLKEVRELLRKKETQMNSEMSQLQGRFDSKLKEYRQKAETMSQAEQMAFQQDLARLQQEGQNVGQEKNQELTGESMRRLQEVKLKVQAFLKDYCAKRGYIFVYAADNKADNIYYKDPSRDITADVIKLLNEQYKTEKKK